MKEQDKLALLKTILLTDDREYAEEISKKIKQLELTLEQRHRLEKKISPIVKDELDTFSREIPEKLGPVITETLKKQIEESKDQVVEALYPILGKMIKKYISQEIKALSEKVNQTARDTLSIEGVKRKIKALFTGVNENEIILSDLSKPEIHQVFIIEKGSGILLGSYHLKNTVDQDMISGMLTAIKAFVEDAFGTEEQNLKSIEYDLYQIHVHNFHKYYIATAIGGTFTQKSENRLESFNLELSESISKVKNSLTEKSTLESILNEKYQLFELTNQKE